MYKKENVKIVTVAVDMHSLLLLAAYCYCCVGLFVAVAALCHTGIFVLIMSGTELV